MTMNSTEDHEEIISGIRCMVHKQKFPDGKYRNVYRFTVPGWEECSITGIRDTKRVIRGRLDPVVRNTLGIKW